MPIANGLLRKSLALCATLALGVTAPSVIAQSELDQEVAFLKQRVFRIPIEVAAGKNQTIRELRLFVSSDRGSNWTRVATVLPSQKQFTFKAKMDGEYWFSLAYVNEEGAVEPEDVSTQPPGLRVIVDTQVPVIQLRPLPPESGGAGVMWKLMDDYPVDLASLKMEYRDKREGTWKELYPEAILEGEIEWPSSAGESYVVRATVEDRAGNTGSAEIELTSGSTAPENDPAPPAPVAQQRPGGFEVPPPPAFSSSANDTPSRPIPRTVSAQPASNAPDQAKPVERHRVAKPAYDAGPEMPAPPTVEPFDRMNPDLPADNVPEKAESPAPKASPVPANRELIATSNQPAARLTGHTVRKPSAEEEKKQPMRIPLVASTRFSVDYAVRGVGPAGVGKVEMHLTKDNGVHWELLGEDSDRMPPFEVELPGEGRFGLAIVVTSPAGHGQKPPQAGDAPKVMVEVDTTAPEAMLYKPTPDPNAPTDALLLSWTTRDSHLSERPVRLYFAEFPEGPWYAIATDLPASGQYSWTVPPKTPHQVYLRLVASDLCNNASAATTPEAVLVDLSRPEAEVIGIAVAPDQDVVR